MDENVTAPQRNEGFIGRRDAQACGFSSGPQGSREGAPRPRAAVLLVPQRHERVAGTRLLRSLLVPEVFVLQTGGAAGQPDATPGTARGLAGRPGAGRSGGFSELQVAFSLKRPLTLWAPPFPAWAPALPRAPPVQVESPRQGCPATPASGVWGAPRPFPGFRRTEPPPPGGLTQPACRPRPPPKTRLVPQSRRAWTCHTASSALGGPGCSGPVLRTLLHPPG